MDDFVLILKTKADCILVKKKIEDFLEKNLKLELNDKSRYYPYKMGVNFCGYRIFTTHKLLRVASKKKIKKNIKKWNHLYQKNRLNIENAMQSFNSWVGHSSHCNSFKLQQKMIKNCDFIFSPYTYKKIEENLINDMTSNKC